MTDKEIVNGLALYLSRPVSKFHVLLISIAGFFVQMDMMVHRGEALVEWWS